MKAMQDLFSQNESKGAPLAERMRPNSLDGFVGQQHIVGKGKLLRRAIQADCLTSSIFFGPPGCGKTTLANIIANTTGSAFVKLNAVSAGVKDVREVIDEASGRLKLYGTSTYLLLDECHRWSKAQSDCILPALEQGVIKFVGSTTENPMISMTSAIVSRCRIFSFLPLSIEDVMGAVQKAVIDDANGFGKLGVDLDEDALHHIARVANGDVRIALNALELAVLTTPLSANGRIHIDRSIAEECIMQKVMQCDDEQFYNMLSAFCKSLRGSDPDAALAWFARLIYAGVDPRIIVRRLIAHASEDIGMANPQAMVQAVSAATALEFIGMPEARLPIAQAIVYICSSAKSNAIVMAVDGAFEDAKTSYNQPVPIHLRDTAYAGAKKLGNGVDYKYPHDYPNHFVPQQYLPLDTPQRFYTPSDQGSEPSVAAAMRARGLL